MSKSRAFLTPNTNPAGFNCWQVFVPDDVMHEMNFRGALLLLSQEWNYEQFGTETPLACAEKWVEGNDLTFAMDECGECEDGLEIGSIIFGAWNATPTGYLPCDGTARSVTTHSSLFAVIGYKFGGSGTTFNLPDITDKFVKGAANPSQQGDLGGSPDHTLTVDEIPAHDHVYSRRTRNLVGVLAGLLQIQQVGEFSDRDTSNTGEDAAHNNEPAFVRLSAAIKA